jgi:hypothetical protein
MSEGGTDAKTWAREPRAGRWVGRLCDWILTGGWFVAANYLAGWRLRVWELAAFCAVWAGVLVAAQFWRDQGWRRAGLAEGVAGIAGFAVANGWLVDRPLSASAILYNVGAIGILLAGWRWWVGRATHTAGDRAEPLRVLGVLLAAVTVSLPLITDHFVSGADARWYAYMLHDFIMQWRAQGPPVFIGQGEFAWNGGVHPFRSAPVYMHLAGAWDWVTGAVLSICSLQHLTAVTAAIAGGLGVYFAGIRLAARRRWEAAGLGILYVVAPGLLLSLMFFDAYMTYLAGAAMVLVLYGNARLLVEQRGWLALAAGLSLVWMSHPPTAMLATLITGVLQGGRLVFGQGGYKEWLRAVGGGAMFLLLSVYYFVGMAEVPPTPWVTAMRLEWVQVGSLGLGWMALAQLVVMRRSPWWCVAFLAAGGLLYATNRPWLAWLVLTSLLLVIAVVAIRRWRWFEAADYGPLLLLGSVFAAAGVMDAALRTHLLAAPPYPQQIDQWRNLWAAHFLQPLTPALNTTGDLQPGWGLWLGWPAAAWAAGRSRAAQLWFAAITLLSVNLVPWPGISAFMVEFFPVNLRDTAGLTQALRVVPVFCGLLAFGALLAWREEQVDSRPWRRRLGAGVLVLAAVWGGFEVRPILARGFRAESSRELTATYWRPDTAHFHRFVYDLVQIPDYYSHGKFYPEMELRLWDANRTELFSPADTVQAMEAAGSRPLRLEARPTDNQPGWFDLQPGFAAQPGERLVLRFEFDPRRRYDGYLFIVGEHGDREYILPASGWPKAFGTGETNGRHLMVWNSGQTVENYRLRIYRVPGNGTESPEGFFANLTLSTYDPARSAIQLESLNPWRARTRFGHEAWLETSRVFLPGYQVMRDGRPLAATEFGRTPDGLLQVRVPPGEHVVELHYTGTAVLRAAGWVSLVAWLGLLARGLFRGWRAVVHENPMPRGRMKPG